MRGVNQAYFQLAIVLRNPQVNPISSCSVEEINTDFRHFPPILGKPNAGFSIASLSSTHGPICSQIIKSISSGGTLDSTVSEANASITLFWKGLKIQNSWFPVN